MRRTKWTMGLAMGAVLIASWSIPAAAQETTRLDTVTVEARRQIDVEPDLARISLGVGATARTADGAIDRLARRTSRVLEALRSAGFTNDELSTTGVSLRRVCLARCEDPNPRDSVRPKPVLGYRGSAGIRIETNKLARLGDAIDIAVGAGVRSVRGVSFDVEDKSAAVQEALRQAMEVAIGKARTLAQTGGRQLGRALIITEGRTTAPVAFAVEDAALRGTASGGGTAPSPGALPFVEPPTLSASARIEVTFELI